jgi:hypothetical protein
MRATITRGLVIFSVLALTACGSRGTLPSQTPASGFSFTGDIAPSATDPCKTLSTEGLWYFHGPCILENVKKSGTTFALKKLAGITQTVKLQAVSGSAPANTGIVTAEGTGKSDITGTFSGRTFPLYGSDCVNTSSSATACAGKAIVYDILVNISENDVTFTGSPLITLTAPTPLKHKKKCTLNQWNGTGSEYLVTPVTGNVKKGKVTLPVFASPFHLNGHTIDTFAISCS